MDPILLARRRYPRGLSPEQADRTVAFLLGFMAAGSLFGVPIGAAATAILLPVWLVCFMVWFLWA
jgi:hypothetical protein